MNSRRYAVVATLVALVGTFVVATPGAAAPVENALTVFPNAIDVTARPGQLVERSLGIVSTGAASGDATLEVVGPAGDFIEVVQDGMVVDHLRLVADATSYVTLRIRPPTSGADGVFDATVRIVPDDGDVRAGSTVDVTVEVGGEATVDVAVVDIFVPDRVTAGSPFHVDAHIDVGGSEAVAVEFALDAGGDGGRIGERAAPPVVGPGPDRAVRASWSTAPWALGVYEATVGVVVEGVEIASITGPFEVVSDDGTEHSIDVLGATLVSRVEVGAVAKFEVTVRNSGATGGRATFAGDVWLDDRAVHAVRSDPIVLAAGSIDTLTVYVPTEVAGAYRVRGRAELDGTASSTFAIPFTVDPPGGRPGGWSTAGLVGLGAAAAALGGGFVAFRRRARSGA